MRMSRQDEPDPGAPERQHWLQRSRSREAKIGAFAAAVIGVAVVVLIVAAPRGQKVATPSTNEGHASAQTPIVTGPPVAANGADRVGLVGLAPEGAKPSLPESGELLLNFAFGHTMGDQGRFTVSVYADGRLIWRRIGDYTRPSTSLLEQRLTPEGVELVRTEATSTGLLDHDLHLTSSQGLNYGAIDFRNGDRLVHVDWGDAGPEPDVARKMPSLAQANALMRLDRRLEDPASWLPASAWEDPEITAYVPPGYSVCYEGGQGVGLSHVLASLPPAATDLLRARENTPGTYTNLAGTFRYWCSELTNDEARALERILDGAGVNGTRDVFGLTYGVPDVAYADATEFSLSFSPLLPHETWRRAP